VTKDEALAIFDEHAARAAELLSYRYWSDSAELIPLARERLLAGFELYPDGPLFKMNAAQLKKEGDEERADALNYAVFEFPLRRVDQPSDSRGEAQEGGSH
jgi:hypothetical protein